MAAEFYTSVTRYGNNILYRGYDEQGKRVKEKIKFSPTLHVPSEKGDQFALDGTKVAPVKFDDMREAKEFFQQYKDVPNFKIYGTKNYIHQYLYKRFPNTIEFDYSKIRWGNTDIEVWAPEFPDPSEAKYPITSITYWSSTDEKYRVYAYKENYKPKRENVIYYKCENEKDLLLKFLDFFTHPNTIPDIITGWNCEFFDTPYLINRIRKVLSEDHVKRLSPWGIVNQKFVNLHGSERECYEIVGISELDYIKVFKKFTANTLGAQESYKLDHIAYAVLGTRKLSYDEYSSLNDLYEKNFEKYIDYNIRDVEIVKGIDDKLGLIMLVCTLAYRAGVNYTDTLGTTTIWDSIIFRVLSKNNIVVPPESREFKKDFPGGYVKVPQVGMHKWIVSFDLASLYPHLIMQANMSPETLLHGSIPDFMSVETCLSKQPINIPGNYSVAPNGALYDNSHKGVLPKIIESYYADRKLIKKRMLSKEQELEDVKEELKRRKLL